MLWIVVDIFAPKKVSIHQKKYSTCLQNEEAFWSEAMYLWKKIIPI